MSTDGDGGSVGHVSVRRGAYHDSVTLLRVSQAAAEVTGISATQVAMATPLILELAAGLGFSVPADTGPNDLLVALRGEDDAALRAGLAAVDAALTARSPASTRPIDFLPVRSGRRPGRTRGQGSSCCPCPDRPCWPRRWTPSRPADTS